MPKLFNAMPEKPVAELQPGDLVLWWDVRLPCLFVCPRGCHFPMRTIVEILKPGEAATDVTGLPALKFWGRRQDTEARGQVTFGLDAQVQLAIGDDAVVETVTVTHRNSWYRVTVSNVPGQSASFRFATAVEYLRVTAQIKPEDARNLIIEASRNGTATAKIG